MNGVYELKGSNTLYKVWGIITHIFTGFYGVLRLIILILLGMGSSMVEDTSFVYGWRRYGGLVLLILLFVVGSVIGFIIRILAGIYLVRGFVRSKGALIAVSVLYFLMALGNLGLAVIYGESGSVVCTLFAIFWMAWAVATGVLLILKQAAVVVGNGFYGTRDYYEVPVYDPVGAIPEENEYELKACIEGLYGDYIGRRYILRLGENCRIGRDSACDIQLRHSKVSRIHCAVKLLSDGRFEITDHSFNGTFYENAALPNGVATIVGAGGMLVIGDADNVLSLNIC